MKQRQPIAVERANVPDLDLAAAAMLPLFLGFLAGRPRGEVAPIVHHDADLGRADDLKRGDLLSDLVDPRHVPGAIPAAANEVIRAEGVQGDRSGHGE